MTARSLQNKLSQGTALEKATFGHFSLILLEEPIFGQPEGTALEKPTFGHFLVILLEKPAATSQQPAASILQPEASSQEGGRRQGRSLKISKTHSQANALFFFP